MSLTSIYKETREILANFDLIDITSATGFVTFDGLNAPDSTGSNYIMMSSSLASALVGVDVKQLTVAVPRPQWSEFLGNGSGVGTPFVDVDFDLSQFQLPRTIEGDGIVKVNLSGDSTQSHGNLILTVKLRKWDGSSETEIVSVTAATEAGFLAGARNSFTLKLVIPRTHFKKGENIRLTIIVSSESTEHMALAHNPRDTAVTNSDNATNLDAGGSRLSLVIPFKLDFL